MLLFLFCNAVGVAMTLEAKNILKEGWLTLFKNKKTGIFNSKPAVRHCLGWD